MRRPLILLATAAACGAAIVLHGCVGDTPDKVQPDGGSGTDAAVDVTANDAAPDAAADAAGDVVTDAGPKSCDITKPFGAPVLVSALAVGGSSNLRFGADYSIGYFSTPRAGGPGNVDIWSTTRSDGGVFGNLAFVPVVNSAVSDGYPTISGDGKTLVFGSGRAGGVGGDDLWVATRTTTLGNFNPPALIANVNTVASENAPFLREDGLRLYFNSDRAPTQGTDDIWVATSNGSSFGAPVHVDELASAASDAYPAVTPDDLVIYFSSTRSGGKGGQDVWVASRTSAGSPFGAPVIVPELNTTADDVPSYITADRCTLYLSSSSGGSFQVYVATRTP